MVSLDPSASTNFRSSRKAVRPNIGGDDGNRTHDPLLAGQVLSQLSYTPSEGLPSFKDLPDFRRVTIPENQTTKVPFLLASAPVGLFHSQPTTDP